MSVMSSDKLAEWVEAEVDRADRLLFSLTPREELDQIAQYQRLIDQAWAGQVRAIVAAHNRAEAARREFACDEVALAINASPTAGAKLSIQALGLAALPGLLEAVEAGMLTQRHALAVLQELDRVEGLDVEVRCSIVLIALARYTRETPGELRKMVERLVLLVDADAAKNRRDKATRQRSVSIYGDVDGQGVVHGRGPLEQVAAIKASLKQWLTDHPKDPDDERTESQREWDLFCSLLTGGAEAGSWQAAFIVPFSAATGGELELAEIPGLGPVLPSTARELFEHTDTVSQVAVDSRGDVIAVSDPVTGPKRQRSSADGEAPVGDTLQGLGGVDGGVDGGDDDGGHEGQDDGEAGGGGSGPSAPPGPSAGPGSSPSALAAPQPGEPPHEDWLAPVLRLMSAPPAARMRAESLSSAAYSTPARLRRYLQARDRTSVFPGCHRRITDVDHRIPWPLGPTAAWNLQLLCRRHHRAKQAVFSVRPTPEGDYLWTTRGGQEFLRQRRGY